MALPTVAALSTSANTTTSNTDFKNVRVKQERADEAEIRELAAKMVEANKAKMAAVAKTGQAQPQQQHMVQPGQLGIQGFLTRNQVTSSSTAKTDEKKSDEKPAMDEASVRGRFGWVTLGKSHIPFIYRLGDKYCVVRMVEMKVLNKYLNYLSPDIYNCTCIRSYYITEAEVRLLNEINIRHCDSQFGREPFTPKDCVVKLQDVEEFYSFLDVCYNKLLLNASGPKEKCGFIRINGESVVPYTVKDGVKYVPLFYFEGETDNLKLKAENLDGWDLCYLKFCCKVQGIRNELFASEKCAVISVMDIKSYFPPGTVFEDYWPNKMVDSHLLLNSKGMNASQQSCAGSWTKQPGISPVSSVHSQAAATNKPTTLPTSTPSMTPVVARTGLSGSVNINSVPVSNVVYNGWSGLVGGQPFSPSVVPQPNQVIRMAQPPTATMHGVPVSRPSSMQTSIVSSLNNSMPHTVSYATSQNNHTGPAAPQPPPLVRVTGPQTTMGYPPYGKDMWSPTYTTPGMPMPNVSSNSLLMGLESSQMLPPHTLSGPTLIHGPPVIPSSPIPASNVPSRPTAPNAVKYPPPLIPVNGTHVPTTRYSYANSNSEEVIDLSSPPRSPQRSPHVGNGRGPTPVGSTNCASPPGRRLVSIDDYPITGQHMPYKVQKALVEGKMVPCINAKPYVYSELLMTLPDLVAHFFPAVPQSSCQQVLQDVLGVDLYSGNRLQMHILQKAGKCQSTNDILPLVQVRDIMQYMPQLDYIVRGMSSVDNPAKRQRTS